MLSTERCRRLLPSGTTISDDELEALREILYAVAETVLDQTTADFEARRGQPDGGVALTDQRPFGDYEDATMTAEREGSPSHPYEVQEVGNVAQ